MDIDTPPELDLSSSFSIHYPLPFRVLFLTFCTLLGFATNLHLLSYLGIDTSQVLDVRLSSSSQTTVYAHPSRLYPPLYKLAGVGLGWTTVGWWGYRWITGGQEEEMVRWRVVPAGVVLAVLVMTGAPWNVAHRRERFMFLSAMRRLLSLNPFASVPFSDIILADILTSSAKVLGDVWVSGCLLFAVEAEGLGGKGVKGCGRTWGVPLMTSIPYLIRLRQCISEIITHSTPTPRRSALNALKYATAFPVIIFSAMQTVVGDPFDDEEEKRGLMRWVKRQAGVGTGDVWIERGLLFKLWIASVVLNSLYSFWWDVTNDWGLSLLTPSGWSSTPSISYAFVNPPAVPPHPQNRRVARLGIPGVGDGNTGEYPPPPSRPISPDRSGTPSKAYHKTSTSTSRRESLAPIENRERGSNPHAHERSHTRAFSTFSFPNLTFPFLRPILLLPDPLIYYLAIFIDLLLRLTWSLKLSSHLHSLHEMEEGIFAMEALEVVRRWMWVFLRVEWEAVRKGGGGGGQPVTMASSNRSWEDQQVVDTEEEIGLGILVERERRESELSEQGPPKF